VVTTLVDSNVIIDLATEDGEWFDWSAAMLQRTGSQGRLVINPIVYAEVAAAYVSIEEADAAMPTTYFVREALPWPAAFIAGRAFAAYRKRSGQKRSPLPDFFIGAHAAIAGYTLLTRDATRYRTYFPKLRIIAP
jgi:predicted nucleic acid-binding protein